MSSGADNIKTALSGITLTWTSDEIKTDKGKYFALISFTGVAAEVTSYWNNIVSDQLVQLDDMASYAIPSEILWKAQNVSCYGGRTGESYKVKTCGISATGVLCEINVAHPQTLTKYEYYQPINYLGAQLMAQAPRQIIVRASLTSPFGTLDCRKDAEDVFTMPICEYKSWDNDCSSIMEGTNDTEIINKCNFTMVKPEVPTRLDDGGILVQGEGLTIRTIDLAQKSKSYKGNIPAIFFTN